MAQIKTLYPIIVSILVFCVILIYKILKSRIKPKKDKKITFLLGAGASAAFISKDGVALTTDYLTNSLMNPDLWDSILLDFKKYFIESKNSYVWNIDKEDVLFVLKRIKDSISTKNKPNFENLLYLLDIVVLNLQCKYDWIEGILPDFWCDKYPDVKKQAFSKSDGQGWRYVPFLAREVLIKAILDIWGDEDALVKKSIAANNLFYKKINTQFRFLNLYSLNYDPLLCESIKDIADIKNTFSGINIGFKNEDFMKAEKIIAFLHGHVGFLPLGNRMYFETNYRDAQVQRLKNIFRNDTYDTKYFDISSAGKHYNTYFISGLKKIDAFYSNPFACYMHRFSKDILESDYIVVIGCSLDDDHLILFLLNTLTYSKKKILFVTKEVAEKDKDLFNQPFIDKFIKAWHKSGDVLKIPLNSADFDLSHHWDQSNKNLINNGFAKISNNVFMYIKGTEEFYKISSIEDLFVSISETQKAL